MALDDNGFKYVISLPGIFKIVMIVSVFLHLFKIEYYLYVPVTLVILYRYVRCVHLYVL